MPVRGDERATATAAMLADTYGQAAKAWLLAGEVVRAEASIGQALALVPVYSTLERSLKVIRARIAAAEEDFDLALSELEAVLRAEPRRTDLLLFVAAAARGTEDYPKAERSLEAYIKQYPDDPAAFLELGNLKDAMGDAAAARAAWLKVLLLEDVGPNAEAARVNIERVDVSKGSEN
jgi:tetratricopeptide (TPR) repeat protein